MSSSPFFSEGPPTSTIFPDVTRVTVVSDGAGREYEGWNLYREGVAAVLQDDGQTLKLLPAPQLIACPHCGAHARAPWFSDSHEFEGICPECHKQYFLVQHKGTWSAQIEDPEPPPRWKITCGQDWIPGNSPNDPPQLCYRWAAIFPHRSDFHYEAHEFTSQQEALAFVSDRLSRR